MLWRDTLIDAAIFREWIVNVGQRPAASRLAHTVVELRQRLAATGRAAGDTFEMPLTQEQISEALGITPVHANRIIRQLRDDGVMDISRGRVTVLDEANWRSLRSSTTAIFTKIRRPKGRANVRRLFRDRGTILRRQNLLRVFQE